MSQSRGHHRTSAGLEALGVKCGDSSSVGPVAGILVTLPTIGWAAWFFTPEAEAF